MLRLRQDSNEKTFRFFEDIEGPGTLDVWSVRLPGVSQPLLLAAAGSPGGSDVTFEVSLIGIVNGEPTEVSPRLMATTQDALCIGRFDGFPGALLLNFVWRDEAHYRPHFYAASIFRWNGSAFVLAEKKGTKRKHVSWRSAAREFGFTCHTNYVEKTLMGNNL